MGKCCSGMACTCKFRDYCDCICDGCDYCSSKGPSFWRRPPVRQPTAAGDSSIGRTGGCVILVVLLLAAVIVVIAVVTH